MNNKNSPVRIIDQKGTVLVKNPPAATTKFNPYTGSTIKTSEAKSYGIWVRSTGGGYARTIPVPISATDSRIVFIRITIPNIEVRVDNPNFTIERLKFFFTFTESIFNQYLESQYFTGDDDNLEKIVTVDTTSVLSVSNTAGQGTMEISAHIARLFRKYTLADLVLLIGSVTTVEGLSSDDLLRIFRANTSKLRLFCQVGFQDLIPIRAGKKVPYVKRTDATVQFTFSDERLTADSLTDIRFSVEGTKKILEFTKSNISRIEYTIYSVVNGITQSVYTGAVGPLAVEQDQFKVVLQYPSNITDFNWINNVVNSEKFILGELYKYSKNLSIQINRVVTTTNVSYTGTTLRDRYGLDEFYVADTTEERFVRPFMKYVMKYDFNTAQRLFVAETGGDTSEVVGFAIVYTGFTTDDGRSYPATIRYRPKVLRNINGVSRYFIVDAFTTGAFASNVPLQRITVYTLLANAHIGSVVVQITNPPLIRLQKFIPTQTQNLGYFYQTIKLSTDKNSIVFNELGKKDNALDAVVNFNLVVQRLVGASWVTLTGGIIQCTMKYNAAYTGAQVYNAQNNLISSVSIARLTSAKGTYRVLAEPRINAAHSQLYEPTSSLTSIQFTR